MCRRLLTWGLSFSVRIEKCWRRFASSAARCSWKLLSLIASYHKNTRNCWRVMRFGTRKMENGTWLEFAKHWFCNSSRSRWPHSESRFQGTWLCRPHCMIVQLFLLNFAAWNCLCWQQSAETAQSWSRGPGMQTVKEIMESWCEDYSLYLVSRLWYDISLPNIQSRISKSQPISSEGCL